MWELFLVLIQCMLATVPLIGGVTGGVAARACPGYWSGLPPCSAVVATLSGAGSVLPQLEWKPQICFWALGGGRWDWSPRTGRRARAVPRVSVLCCVTWHLLCHLTKYTVASTALGPISTLGMPATGPGVPQALFPQEHQCRSTRVRSWDHIRHSSGPGGSYKGSADPGPAQSPGHMPTKPLTAEATPFQPWTHPVSTLMPYRHWIYKASGRGVRLWLAQPQG